MQSRSPWLSPRRFWRLALAVLLPAVLSGAAEKEEPVAVFAQVFNSYARTRLPDKSFKPEAYVFGEGGCWTRPVKDAAMEEMTFLRVARAVAAPLGRLKYRPALTSAEAELMILVFWGSTEGSRGNDPAGTRDRLSSATSAHIAAQAADQVPKTDVAQANPANAAAESAYDDALWQMELANRERDQLDDRNARILGYAEVLDRARSATHMGFAQDTFVEVGNNRYYVVLQAYDFKTAVKEKKLKPLWTARISMEESGNDFAQALDHMLRIATPYLGQDSGGLRRYLSRETRVDLGPLEVLETLPAK